MKKTITAITLALVLTFGATFANAGILVSNGPAATDCKAEQDGGIVKDIKDVIKEILGILVSNRPVAAETPCTQEVDKNGILVSDRNGILVSN